MRLDLISYIRQLLLPTWKQPENIGLAQMLFQPIQAIHDAIEAYERAALYRAALTGQKLILQHYLQQVVDGQIKLINQDGLRLDFAVIVPETLSPEGHRKVRDIVDAYKLAGKRYEIRDAFALAGTGSTAIHFATGYPTYGEEKIVWAIDTSGGFLTRIKKRGTTVYLLDEVLNYQVGVPYVFEAVPGDYDIEVGGLYYQLYVAGSEYSFSIASVEPIPGDTNGAWRINLGESIRGMRLFSIEWFKGASTTPISSFEVPLLDTHVVNYLYFNPKSEEPWHIKSNGAGSYRVVVKHLLNGIAYADQKTVNFTNANLGISTDTYTMSIASVARILGDANFAWKINLVESVRGIRTFTIEWFEGVETTPISTLVVPNLDTNEVQYLYFKPRSESPWHILSNGAGLYRVKVSVTVNSVGYNDDQTVTFTNDDLGIVDPVDPGEPGDVSWVTTGGIELEYDEETGLLSIVDTDMSVAMSRSKTFAYDGSINLGTESSNWIGYIFLNDVPWKNADNTRKDFEGVALSANQVNVVRVIWLEESYYNSFNKLKTDFWRIREPRIHQGEAYAGYHPWKFWKQAYAIIKT